MARRRKPSEPSKRARKIEPRPEVFVDASFLIPLFEPGHPNHNEAVRWLHYYAKRSVLTTTIVLAESCDHEPSPHRLQQLGAFMHLVDADPYSLICEVDTSLVETVRMARQQEPTWRSGLSDCISYVVMRHFGVTEALTADRHFEEPGFRVMFQERAP